jgi:hypothetical protein
MRPAPALSTVAAQRSALWRRNVSDQRAEDNITRIAARLPGLDIAIIHRRSLHDEAEQISINLRAMLPPSRHLAGFLSRPTHLHFGPRQSKSRGFHGLTPRVPWAAPDHCLDASKVELEWNEAASNE